MMNVPLNPLRLAVMGLRHGHILSLLSAVKVRPDVVLVGVCEEDATTRAALSQEILTLLDGCPVFESYSAMLEQLECEVIAVGDFYGKRGAIAIEALRHGKHVVSDKPVCTQLAELDEIERLVGETGLQLGCMLDIRDSGTFRRLRRLVRDGEIGDVRAISFGGQHPLLPVTRPAWYFEAGKQGGTLNDIAVHAIDFVPWITGRKFASLTAARTWNTAPQSHPHLDDAAQMMATLEGGCGVMGDVSYLAPDSFGYSMPHYWRTIMWGALGVAEASASAPEVTLYLSGENRPVQLAPDDARHGGYLDDFLAQVRGVAGEVNGDPERLTTAGILRVSRIALMVQHAASTGATNVPLASETARSYGE